MTIQKHLTILITGLVLTATNIYAADVDGGKNKSATCSSCHGRNGVSLDPTRPNLAGQSAEYIFQQLQAFKLGKRINPVMNKIASGLNESDMRNLSAFYSRQTLPTSRTDLSLVSTGKSKYFQCWGCHGKNAEGGDGYPRLAGQNPAYVIAQLDSFKRGIRKNPAMNSILLTMNGDDFNALAAYVASLNVDGQ